MVEKCVLSKEIEASDLSCVKNLIFTHDNRHFCYLKKKSDFGLTFEVGVVQVYPSI